MMMTVFVSMFMFALIGAISPGPVNIIATGTGATFGLRRALPHVMGATLSYTLIVFVVGIGLNGVLSQYPQITQGLQYIGSGFLLYMAVKIATAKPMTTEVTTAIKPPSMLEGALSQGLNPKAWLVSMSGVSLFVSANTPPSLYLLVFCVISFIVCLVSIGTWALLGELISRYLANHRRQVIFNFCMGLLLSSSVLLMWIGDH